MISKELGEPNRARKWLLLGLSSLILCWPAFWNGFPLVFADTDTYLRGGQLVPALLGGEPYLFWRRSTLYELSIIPLHLGQRWAWPVLFAQSLATVWVIHLTQRKLVGSRDGKAFLKIILALAVLSPLPWFVSLLTPDLFSGLVVLALYWLGPGWKQLHWKEQFFIVVVGAWTLTGHTANYPAALALSVLALCLRLPWASLRCLALVACCVLLQLGVNYRIYHRWGLQIEQPPFLLARLIEDGTAFPFLREHGGNYALAGHFEGFRSEHWHVLWSEDGLVNRLRSDKGEIWERLRKEELSLCLDICRTYPWQQAKATLSNVFKQAIAHNAGAPFYMDKATFERFERDSPLLALSYSKSRQAHGALEKPEWLTWLFITGTMLSLLVLLLTTRQFGAGQRLLLWVVIGIFFSHLTSAGLSAPSSRYNLRVLWLLPVMATLSWTASRLTPDRPGGSLEGVKTS